MESCTYGIQITMANFFNFAIAFSIGFIAGSLPEMALFYCIFVSLRFFCGGYHADSYGKCFSLFAVTCSMYLAMVQGLLSYGGTQGIFLAAALIFLGICIFRKAPIEHDNRPFEPGEREVFRKRSIQLYLFWSVTGIALWVGQIWHLSAGFISVVIIIFVYMMIDWKEGKE